MAALTQDMGSVLRTTRHGETSLIVTAFTREGGKVGLMAKGARAKSKLGASAALQLFAESQFVYYHKAGRELQLLKEWSLAKSHMGIREDLKLLTIASALVELLSKCLREDDPHPNLYDAAISTLSTMAEKPANPLPLLWAFELQLFFELGFALQCEQCLETAKPFAPPFHQPLRYRMLDGGFLHPHVVSSAKSDGELSAQAFVILTKLPTANVSLLGKLSVAPRVEHEILRFLATYLETHLPVRGKLRSLAALYWNNHTLDSPVS